MKERLLLPYLFTAFTLNPSQHGFRAGRCAVTALLPLATAVAKDFNKRKPAVRTGMLSIDLLKAFDVADREKLLQKIDATPSTQTLSGA